MRINSENVMKIMEEMAPLRYAQSWDSVGFQIGKRYRRIDKVMVTLEVTEAVIEEAIEESVDLILSHHPLLFDPVKKITMDDPVGNLVIRLIEQRINLIVAHTNLDVSRVGTNAYLAQRLGLRRIENLTDAYSEPVFKLVIYVPASHADVLREVLEASGAGSFGGYSGCTFSTMGTGTFRPLAGSEPYIGREGILEKVDEIRLEAIVPEALLGKALDKILAAHPYEVPAYDVIPLENRLDTPGFGLIGYLEKGRTLEKFAGEIKDMLGCSGLRIVRCHEKPIHKIALCTGSGSDLIREARKKGADVLITGDLKYHDAQLARSIGLSVMDAGHFETEQFYIPQWEKLLKEAFEKADYDVQVIRSTRLANPMETI